jgi:hypothetical protein
MMDARPSKARSAPRANWLSFTPLLWRILEYVGALGLVRGELPAESALGSSLSVVKTASFL